jgi:hypothetical protein
MGFIFFGFCLSRISGYRLKNSRCQRPLLLLDFTSLDFARAVNYEQLRSSTKDTALGRSFGRRPRQVVLRNERTDLDLDRFPYQFCASPSVLHSAEGGYLRSTVWERSETESGNNAGARRRSGAERVREREVENERKV